MMVIASGKFLDILLTFIVLVQITLSETSLVTVKNVTLLGPQVNPGLPGLSRDGGASVLLDGKVIWLFDDTQVLSGTGQLELFLSNTASYSYDPNKNITVLQDFGTPVAQKYMLSEQKSVQNQNTLKKWWVGAVHAQRGSSE